MSRPMLALACMLALPFPTLAADPPKIIRENIEWLDVWVPGNETKGLPRVLLVGDSITRGYYKTVEEKLAGKAVVARLGTSKSAGDPGLLAEVNLVLSQTRFDLIHFNNGLHGWGYTEEEYATALPEVVGALRKGAPGAKLIWATTTPVRVPGKLEQFDAKTERVKARNKAAATLMAAEKVPTDDLFALAIENPDWYSGDGVHFSAKGTAALGEQVAGVILKALAEAPSER